MYRQDAKTMNRTTKTNLLNPYRSGEIDVLRGEWSVIKGTVVGVMRGKRGVSIFGGETLSSEQTNRFTSGASGTWCIHWEGRVPCCVAGFRCGRAGENRVVRRMDPFASKLLSGKGHVHRRKL